MVYRSAASDLRPLLQVVTSRFELVLGADALPGGDHRVVLRRAGQPALTATATRALVEAVRVVIDPPALAKLGAKVGVGVESARLSWCEDPECEIDFRWHGADAVAGAAHAARDRLRIVVDLVAALERGASRLELGAFPWLEQRARVLRPRAPIVSANEHGRLSVRFRVTPGYQPSAEAIGTWYKLYDTGVVERRRNADIDDDGTPDGVGNIPEERARTIAQLATIPLSFSGDDVSFEWQVYGAVGTRIAGYACSVNSDMGGPGASAALLYELSSLTYGFR